MIILITTMPTIMIVITMFECFAAHDELKTCMMIKLRLWIQHLYYIETSALSEQACFPSWVRGESYQSDWLKTLNHDRSQAFILLPMLSCNSRALGNIPTLKWGHAQATWMLLAWAMFQEWPTMCTLHRATNKTFMVNNTERLTLLKYAVEADCSKEMPTHRMRSACRTSSSMMSNTSSGVITSSASAHADHG